MGMANYTKLILDYQIKIIFIYKELLKKLLMPIINE